MTINLREVDGVNIQLKHKATCHCGAVEIEVHLPDGLVEVLILKLWQYLCVDIVRQKIREDND